MGESRPRQAYCPPSRRPRGGPPSAASRRRASDGRSILYNARVTTAARSKAPTSFVPEAPAPRTDPLRAPPADLTPAMRQYWEHKREVGDALLLFRMGDFYELFYDDAEKAAKLLGITLTSRDGGRTPLAGIPYHALDGYLRKLVAAGVKVAISEQVEDAKNAKGVIRRALTRIVTPGTLTEDTLLERHASNVLAAAVESAGVVGLAALELSTGYFEVQLVPPAAAIAELARMAPAEVLLADRGSAAAATVSADRVRDVVGAAITWRTPTDFSPARAEDLFRRTFGTRNLEGFGFEEIDPSLQAAGALLAYVAETQRGETSHLRPPRRRSGGDTLALDPVTLRSLEIEKTMRSGARAGSLLAAMDQTATPMGARLLRTWLCYPLLDLERIARRQRMIGGLIGALAVRRELRALLRDVGDIERIVGRLGVQRITPRDVRAVGDTLALLAPLRGFLAELEIDEARELAARLDGLDELGERLRTALRPDAPTTLKDGDIFNEGVDAELDRLRRIGRDGQQWLAEYQARELARTGISTLKVAFNRIHGYYIEITNPHRDRVPADYQRRQTVKNAERYVTDELKRFEGESLSAESRANELEYELFQQIRAVVAERIPELQRAAAALAELDILAGWAQLAHDRKYCCPEFVEAPILEIEDGRHPVVEQLVEGEFTRNDTRLGAADIGGAAAEASSESAVASLALITGPNMSGKSTYIRQVALLALLAHCGAWVSAKRMRLGRVDRIFTRVGAADELARGQSTFMVEMVETANILHNATARSIVILDEVGRGTSTFDGLALAWAITEHLASITRCRALFATHYHELTEIADILPNVANLNVAVREFEDQVVFLHKIVPGAANMSYGLHVAKLAGVPQPVLERANAVLTELERHFLDEAQRSVLAAAQRRRTRQLRLFETPEEAIVREIRSLAGDAPGERALELVQKWRGMLGGHGMGG